MSVTYSEGGRAVGIAGEIFAAVLSYAKWHSIGYMILHFLCGWFYVVWYVAKYGLR